MEKKRFSLVTSDLTSRILAYKELKDFNIDQAVDWAIEMLYLGYETPSILILAGISKPTNFFETEKCLLDSLKELGIAVPEKHEAILGYCKYLIAQISRSISVKANLYELHNVANTIDRDDSIFDFYLFYWAWVDLDYGEVYQDYIPEATIDNIEELLINRAIEWLKDYPPGQSDVHSQRKSKTMKAAIDYLSDKELELYKYVKSLEGTMNSRTRQLAEKGVFDQYRTIHKNYLDLFFHTDNDETKMEILKRLIFLNWYSLVEHSCYTGIEELDRSIIFHSYSILNNCLIGNDNEIDTEFKWMLSYYCSWDYAILEFSKNRLETLTQFVKGVDGSISHAPKNQLPKGCMDGRGQMGIYWISCSVEKQN